jgi:catalase
MIEMVFGSADRVSEMVHQVTFVNGSRGLPTNRQEINGHGSQT